MTAVRTIAQTARATSRTTPALTVTPKRPASRRIWLARALQAALAATVLAHGAASTVESDFAALGFSLVAVFAVASPIAQPRLAAMQALALLLLAALIALALWQAAPIVDADLANPAWRALAASIDGAPPRGAISVAPGMTFAALPALATPFLAFAIALACCQSDEETLRLWRWLAYFGAAYAAFAVVQEVFWPEQLLFEPKRFYIGDLTGAFVNRNTAGTFFGVAFLLNLATLFADLRRLPLAGLARSAARGGLLRRGPHAELLLHGLAALVCATALFLTKSRGAVGATLAASLLAAALTTARRMTADSTGEARLERRRRLAGALAAFALVAAPFLLFAGRPALRMGAPAADDLRWCAFASELAAIKDNWPLGAGFGAFADVFPAYRDADCVGIVGVWDRAHDFFLEGLLGFGLSFVAAAGLAYGTLGAALARGVLARRRLRFLPVAGLAALALVTLHSIVDFSLQIPGVATYFAAAIGAAVAASLAPQRSSGGEPASLSGN